MLPASPGPVIDMDALLLLFALALFSSILLAPVVSRLGGPLLLLFLGMGMLVGENGIVGLQFDQFSVAYEVGTIALALILLSGGLDTPLRDLKDAAGPSLALATGGVVLTSGIVGLGAMFAFGLPLEYGLLMGAVVGSTDAAATFLLLRQAGVRLIGRVRETLLVESGINDPMAILLTILLVGLVDTGMPLSWGLAPEIALLLGQQFGIAAALGIGGGLGVAMLSRRLALPPGLHGPFVLTAALTIFAVTRLLDGSGFLAIYLFGIAATALGSRMTSRVAQFHDGLAWLAQIIMFLMLGLLVTPASLGETALPALAVAFVLIFVARPVAVLACLTPFRVPLRQQAYIGWVGLRGAVPIFLAIIPVISPGPVTVEFFNIVFVVVIASLVLQGWTIAPMARWLGVTGERAVEVRPPASP